MTDLSATREVAENILSITRCDLTGPFSRRERQIMDAVFALGEASVAEVVEQIGDPAAHDSVRVTLGILERKGHLRHRQEGNRNIYRPTVSREKAGRTAMDHLLRTFFEGSPSRAILAFLDQTRDRLSEEELEDIAVWLEQQRREDR